ncbi:tetratricopeptide repeat protein 36 homolog [Patella vulgata]|uniref:tetratricopeptide repeat protein 36 homolog n=1 Tax=Patella vulgata TaxID=6465 RepID=UPI00217FB0E7|nr:tetratricopeptide repeat protein 36 homolog [Patella vulgata]
MATSMKCEITSHDNAILSQIFNPNLPYLECEEKTCDTPVFIEPPPSQAVLEAKELELQGVQLAETGDIDGALNLFNQAVAKAPEWPSAYNNRAQAYRMKGQNEEALLDLSKAIQLSNGIGKPAKQAFTQRALLRKLAGNDEDALEDFKKAAQLGNEFAKQQIVAANPYAAMCNAMLGEVIHKIRTGEQSTN